MTEEQADQREPSVSSECYLVLAGVEGKEHKVGEGDYAVRVLSSERGYLMVHGVV